MQSEGKSGKNNVRPLVLDLYYYVRSYPRYYTSVKFLVNASKVLSVLNATANCPYAVSTLPLPFHYSANPLNRFSKSISQRK